MDRFLYQKLGTLKHYNGMPLVEFYCDTNFEDIAIQGGILTFNLMKSTGEYIGYVEVSAK